MMRKPIYLVAACAFAAAAILVWSQDAIISSRANTDSLLAHEPPAEAAMTAAISPIEMTRAYNRPLPVEQRDAFGHLALPDIDPSVLTTALGGSIVLPFSTRLSAPEVPEPPAAFSAPIRSAQVTATMPAGLRQPPIASMRPDRPPLFFGYVEFDVDPDMPGGVPGFGPLP